MLLYGQYPTPGPPRSDIEELLGQGGARVFVSFEKFMTHITSAAAEGENKSAGNTSSSSSSGDSSNHYQNRVSSQYKQLVRNCVLFSIKSFIQIRAQVVICTNLEFKDEFVAQLPPEAELSFQVNSGRRLFGGNDYVLHVVSPLWALDSITNYQLLPAVEYEV